MAHEWRKLSDRIVKLESLQMFPSSERETPTLRDLATVSEATLAGGL